MLITVCAQSICIRGSPYAFFFRAIPICIRGLKLIPVWKYAHMVAIFLFPICARTPYAYGLVTGQSLYAYGDCPNPRMHMGITNIVIPVCIRGLELSPYAYGDPRMHTGITMFVISVCIWGLGQSLYAYVHALATPKDHKNSIPVRIWGSPYAYGD